MSPDIAASEPIVDMLLNAEESWLQRLLDPSAPLPSTDQRYDGGSHDLNTPVKNLWVNNLISTVIVLWLLFKFWIYFSFFSHPIVCSLFLHLLCPYQLRNPLGLPISKRDSLLEKCAMFREAGGALNRQPSQDNVLDGPFSSGASKLEQVLCILVSSHNKNHSESTDNQRSRS